MIKIDKWAKELGVKFLKEVGVRKGDIIFDCCCGEGNYTIPAAKIAGKNSTVYAMDMNKNRLSILKKKSNLENLKNIKIMGLMTMGPRVGNPEDSRPYFIETRKTFEKLKKFASARMEMKYLSMGMTNSYKIAIEEGANIVRIGTKIFGERD